MKKEEAEAKATKEKDAGHTAEVVKIVELGVDLMKDPGGPLEELVRYEVHVRKNGPDKGLEIWR